MSNSNSTLTQARLKELLHYEPSTGIFTWRKVTTNRVSVGDVAGSVTVKGYIGIGMMGKLFYAHRLAWLYVFGVWPSKDIDHIDRKKLNNSIHNLREISAAENQHNCSDRKNNKSGARGVSWDRENGKWLAKITLHRKQIYLGLFDDLEEASNVYQSAKSHMHPAYVRSVNDAR